jgi:hypothetical protein
MFAAKENSKQQSVFASEPKNWDKKLGGMQPPDQAWDSLHFLQRNLGNGYLQATNQTDLQSCELRIQRTCSCSGSCASCAIKKDDQQEIRTKRVFGNQRVESEEEEKVVIQSKEATDQKTKVSPTVESPPPPPVWTPDPKCSPDYCKPFSTRIEAMADRKNRAFLALGLGLFSLNSTVCRLFDQFIWGGNSTVQDVSPELAEDFQRSNDTAKTTRFLMDAMSRHIKARYGPVPPTVSMKLDIKDLIPNELEEIDNPSSSHAMNFEVKPDPPGLLAGGIGKEQIDNKIGNKPSCQNDSREARGTISVEVYSNSPSAGDRLIMFTPSLDYTVRDTVDFCPGNCGSEIAQLLATVAFSRWEASGISGDVPFQVNFPAPPLELTPLILKISKTGITSLGQSLYD